MRLQPLIAALAAAVAAATLPAASAFSQTARGAAPEAATKPAPVRPLAFYISEYDYPVEAIARRQQGETGFRLFVDAKGKVTGCSVVRPSGSPALDTASCQLMAGRARFRPARDAGGRPVAGTFTTGIRWVLPKVMHDERLERAYLLWFECAMAETDKLAPTKLHLHRLTGDVLAECAREETDAIRAVGAEIWLIPARNSMRRAIATRLAQKRGRTAGVAAK